MKTKNNKLLTLLTVLTLLALPLSVFAQHLQNDHGNAKIKNAGTIRFVNNTGEFQNGAANANMGQGYDGEFLSGTSGTIEFAGSTNIFAGTTPIAQDDATRVNGWVVYNSGSAQTLDANTWYTNLGLRGAGTKSFGAGTYNVDHIYQSDRTGTRDYGTSTVIYDGTGAGTEDQDVFAENGAAANSNAYYNLHFLNTGIKTLKTDATYWQNNAVNEINLDANAVYIVKGTQQALGGATVTTTAGTVIDVYGNATANAQDGWFRTNTGAGTIAGDVYIHTNGTYITDDAGLQTFSGDVKVGDDYLGAITNTSGSLTLDGGNMTFANGSTLTLTSAAGHIVNGDGRTLKFEGSADFEVNPAWATGTNERPNMEFHVNSTTEYSGADDIEAAVHDYPYGNLVVSSASNVKIEQTAGAVSYVAGNFSLTTADLWADGDADPTNGASQVLAMLNETKTMTYGNNLEVIGSVRRYPNNTSTTMTFNNGATQSAITDNPGSVTWLQYSIWKNQAPTEDGGTGNAGDVRRRTLFNVSESAQDWKAHIRLGFQDAECPQHTPDYYNSLRFRKYTPQNGTSTKITTGIAVQRNYAFTTAGTFGYADLYGFMTGAGDADLAETVPNGDEIFLRGGPAWFITINNGRWSNPNTWDEGIQPGPNDLCLVRHTVWAGYVNQLDNYQINENVHLATFGTNVNELASYIQIYNAAAAGSDPAYHGALVFGEKDSDDPAASHETDPAWGLKNSGADLSAWQNQAGEAGAVLTTGTVYITPLLDGAPADIADAVIVLQHQADGADHTLYNSGLFVHAQTQFTVPRLLTNKSEIQNAGTIIVGE